MEPPTITATELLPDGSIKSSFAFTFAQEQEAQSVFSTPQHFLYEPNAALLKAGAFKWIGAIFTLAKIDRHTHLYTSDHLIENFPGRVFKIEIANATHEQVKALQQANVLTRNYPLSPEALKKKLKLKDGGDRYVIGYTCQQERYLSIASRIL